LVNDLSTVEEVLALKAASTANAVGMTFRHALTRSGPDKHEGKPPRSVPSLPEPVSRTA